MSLLFIKEENFEHLLWLIDDPEERAILQTLFRHCIDANRDNDRLTDEDVNFCLRF